MGNDTCNETAAIIVGSNKWLSCWHGNMRICRDGCICDEGYVYDAVRDGCISPELFVPPVSRALKVTYSWESCWQPHMHLCGNSCCCDDGFEYDNDGMSCVPTSAETAEAVKEGTGRAEREGEGTGRAEREGEGEGTGKAVK